MGTHSLPDNGQEIVRFENARKTYQMGTEKVHA